MADSQRNHEVVPNPDPSAITTAQIEKAVNNLELRMQARFDGMEKAVQVFHADLTRVPTLLDRSILGLRELLETRIHCMEDDVKSVHAFLDLRGKDIEDRIVHLRELVFDKIEKLSDVSDEKFVALSTQISERDTIKEQTARDVKGAVDAAFAAAKEAVSEQNKSNALSISKSEAAFTKQIDQIGIIITTMAKGIDDKIDDIKARITTIESRKEAANEGVLRTDRSQDRTSSIIGMIIAGSVGTVVIMTAIISVVAFVLARN